jgi:hypothetical protein
LPETLAYFFSFKNGPKKTIAQIGENSPNLVTLLACEVWRRKIISPQKKMFRNRQKVEPRRT